MFKFEIDPKFVVVAVIALFIIGAAMVGQSCAADHASATEIVSVVRGFIKL